MQFNKREAGVVKDLVEATMCLPTKGHLCALGRILKCAGILGVNILNNIRFELFCATIKQQ